MKKRIFHIAKELNISHTEISENLERIAQLTQNDKTKPIVVYCQSGLSLI